MLTGAQLPALDGRRGQARRGRLPSTVVEGRREPSLGNASQAAAHAEPLARLVPLGPHTRLTGRLRARRRWTASEAKTAPGRPLH